MNYMVLKIDDSTIKSTTNCEKGMQCLHGVTEKLCKVNNSVMNEVFFVSCLNKQKCSYRISFGYKFMCTCPIRKEIFRRYHY